jgi:hypothetical protein
MEKEWGMAYRCFPAALGHSSLCFFLFIESITVSPSFRDLLFEFLHPISWSGFLQEQKAPKIKG